MPSRSLRVTSHPKTRIRDWYKRRDEIDFEPPYQRKGNIWSEKDKAFLIDSIINGFDIPKFYVADFGFAASELRTGSNVYAIIDGKQRLQAIFDFMDSKYPLDRNFSWRLDEDLELAGKTYRELSDFYPEVAGLVDDFVIDVMSVVTDDPDDINELFKRLNKGKSLTGAEVRNAALGPVADMVRVVAKHDFFEHNVRFNTIRLGDMNTAAKILLFEYRGYPTSTKKKDLDTFYETDAIDEIIEAAGLKCNAHLDSMCQIFVEKDVLLANSGQVPAFYWFIKLAPFDSHSFIRDFLLEFYEKRMESRQAQAENRLDDVDPRLARYDVLDRNTNDAGSQRARIAILLDAFSDYLSQDQQTAGLQPLVSDAHRSFLLEMRDNFRHEWHY